MSRYELLHGDCLEKLKSLPDNSVDAVVTDPPAGIAFMGRSWDEDKGGRREWIAWLASIMGECLRVIKPGGHALVWALPRTSHWTATALEDAGFEVRDCIVHLFGSGFPKSANISKMIDKMNGAAFASVPAIGVGFMNAEGKGGYNVTKNRLIRIGDSTEAARQWEGFGSALKPASEHWWLCRKPLTGTIAANVLEWGTGGINVDACRVGGVKPLMGERTQTVVAARSMANTTTGRTSTGGVTTEGRFPPNVLFSHLPECRQVGTKRVKGTSIPRDQPMIATRRSGVHAEAGGHQSIGREQPVKGHADPDGLETVEAWECADGCAVAELDSQSGITKSVQSTGRNGKDNASATFGFERKLDMPRGHSDSGGASRFFPAFRYQAKAPPKERKVEGVEGQHPTQKPEALCRWLVRLVTPPNGVVLDPFTGSGTTGVAALLEGFRFIGCEREDEYYAIAKARLDNAEKQQHGKQSTLFDLEAS